MLIPYHSLNQFIKDNVITIGVILEAMRNYQHKYKKIKLLHLAQMKFMVNHQ